MQKSDDAQDVWKCWNVKKATILVAPGPLEVRWLGIKGLKGNRTGPGTELRGIDLSWTRSSDSQATGTRGNFCAHTPKENLPPGAKSPLHSLKNHTL